MDIEKYIEERVDGQISWYDKKSSTAQKYYKIYQIVEISLAASIPLLAGFTDIHWAFALVVGIFGSVIAVIEAITKLYKFHENWISYRSTCEFLKYQKYLYLSKSFPYNEKDETVDNIFVKNIENIISAENNQWKVINTMEEKNQAKPND